MAVSESQPLVELLSAGLSTERAASIGMNLALVVDAKHRQGEVYGNLEPAVVWVAPDNTVVLREQVPLDPDGDLDPTLAVLEELARARAPTDRPVAGRLSYQSPEEVDGHPPTVLSEVFSVGTILYEMATGNAAFPGSSRSDIATAVSNAALKDVLELAPRVPPALARVVHRCLEPVPTDRYSSMSELADELDKIVNPRHKHRTTIKTEPVSTGLVDEPSAFDDITDHKSEPQARSEPSPSVATTRSVRRLRRAVVGLSVAAAIAVVAAIVVAVRADIKVAAKSSVDPQTLLVVPLDIRGQDEAADYLGRALAESVAVNLALDRSLRILPVPNDQQLEQSEEQIGLALSEGAGRMVTGSLTRADGRLNATLSLVDTRENRIEWGATESGSGTDYTQLAVALVRRLGEHLGAEFPDMYDYVTNLTGSAEMAASPTTASALAALRDGDIDNALAKTESLVQEFPDEPDARALRAHALLMEWDARPTPDNLGELDRALDVLRELDPKSPYETFYRGYVAQARGDGQDALISYSKLLDRDDLTPRARAWVLKYRANVEQTLQDNSAALNDLEEALRVDPANPWTIAIFSETLRNAGRLDDALVRARQAVQLAPNYWRFHQSHGFALSALKRFDEAIPAFDRACELSQAQLPCSLLAIHLLRDGARDKSIVAAELASEQPATADGQYNLACFYALAEDPVRALDYLARAAELGFRSDDVKSDPDLESLRGNPRFEEIAERIRGIRPD
ncbi:MAG: protein kinase family protein [Myxococcota bacterium]